MITGKDIASSPWIQGVMKSAANLKPAKPKYDSSWDLDILLDYWESQPENASLSLSALLDKSLSLLMAAGIMRSSDLNRIDRTTVQFSESSVTFRLKDPKNAKGWTQPIVVAAVASRPKVCPVRAFRAYLAAIHPHRASLKQKATVWLGSRHPHLPILTKSIASRVLKVLQSAGLDTSRFTAHSVRMAAVSKAIEMGIPLEEIMLHGRWRSEKVFRVFYERSRRKGVVSTAIMTRRKTMSK